MDSSLINKYNTSIPRYTSYPTLPFWNESIEVNDWKDIFRKQFEFHNHQQGISLYIHLPFCESLCTYCGCNKKITKQHSVEEQYIEALIKEWNLYLGMMNSQPIIREIHLGGGTPSFFSPKNLDRILNSIFQAAIIHPQYEFSFEGHPNNTTKEHLETLYRLGFRRVSLGVQDNDPEVQKIINRIQPLENVRKVTQWARAIGYHSVNYDLVYGLPLQTEERLVRTVQELLALLPDRIAFYSYAHVPWTSKGQRLYDESHLPNPDLKTKLHQIGKQLFLNAGYEYIGMDHFALPSDDLSIAYQKGALHRNFMGYTNQKTSMLIGLGVSSISDISVAFAQNDKILERYYNRIFLDNELPISKGYFLNEEDIKIKNYILDISCRGKVRFNQEDLPMLEKFVFPRLIEMKLDGLLDFDREGLLVSEIGRQFTRNICSAFDLKLLLSKEVFNQPVFSKAV